MFAERFRYWVGNHTPRKTCTRCGAIYIAFLSWGGLCQQCHIDKEYNKRNLTDVKRIDDDEQNEGSVKQN